ncbi:MAG: HIT family protein [Chloroflexi bacterium]|nr:HIT family protein [Chloroflexota bacterium]
MYNHAPDSYQCPFCLLIQGIKNENVESVYTDIICQNDVVTAFIGSRQWPRNPGNVIIVPNKHYENIYELPPQLAGAVQEAAQIIALMMKRTYHCDGISTRQHNEPAGNQDVWHYHLHVTPRFEDDRLYHTLATERMLMPSEERAWHAQQLKAQLVG